ncbi:N-6 DNA methylase, partial [Haemophilus paraphrohaemolyticus]
MNKMQNNAFTIAETAEFFSVSTATIRNWVKAGYLSLIEKGKIDKQSVFEFKANKLGKEKLTSRANKSQKDSHNHQELTQFILQEIESNNIAYLGKRYEESLSDSYRNKEGIYYTPEEIVNDLLNIKGDLSTKTFLDPCCGSGNFIMRTIELGVKPENIYGIDIDPVAVEITK